MDRAMNVWTTVLVTDRHGTSEWIDGLRNLGWKEGIKEVGK